MIVVKWLLLIPMSISVIAVIGAKIVKFFKPAVWLPSQWYFEVFVAPGLIVFAVAVFVYGAIEVWKVIQ